MHASILLWVKHKKLQNAETDQIILPPHPAQAKCLK